MIWNCLILYILCGLMLCPFTVISAAFIAGSKVNCHHRNDPSSPWGGFGQSGIGRENGPEAFEEYTTTKSLTIRTRPKVWTFWTRIMSMHVNATLANVGTFRIRYSQAIVKRRARTHTGHGTYTLGTTALLYMVVHAVDERSGHTTFVPFQFFSILFIYFLIFVYLGFRHWTRRWVPSLYAGRMKRQRIGLEADLPATAEEGNSSWISWTCNIPIRKNACDSGVRWHGFSFESLVLVESSHDMQLGRSGFLPRSSKFSWWTLLHLGPEKTPQQVTSRTRRKIYTE